MQGLEMQRPPFGGPTPAQMGNQMPTSVNPMSISQTPPVSLLYFYSHLRLDYFEQIFRTNRSNRWKHGLRQKLVTVNHIIITLRPGRQLGPSLRTLRF